MGTNDFSVEIKGYTKVVKAFRKSKELYDNEIEILQLCKARYELYYQQIHCYLAGLHTDESEKQIQSLVKDVFKYDLPICESKIEKFEYAITVYKRKKDEEKETLAWRYLQDWLQLYENNYALVSFRSLEHFARFLEWDKQDSQKVWKYSIDPNNDGGKTGVNFPFFYYFNQMVLKKDIKFISKQYPTGYGKSYSNIIAISWLLGVDTDNDCLLVLGNPALVLTQTKGIVDTMCNERFCKVFPQFADCIEVAKIVNANGEEKAISSVNQNKMFSVCRQKDGELTLSISNKSMNVKVISKDTPIDGIRVKYLFLDDICRSKDAGNNKAHETDIDNYWNSWWKRNYNTNDFYIIIGGTAYSIYDILSTLIRYYSEGKMEHSNINKYTYTSLDKKNVFIKIPKLDTDNDESTYPQKYPTEEARRMRERDLRSFMAMEQQQPMPPETTPFYWDNLNTYETIPYEHKECSDSCWASIDPIRIGNDNFSMPIHRKIGDWHYLVDCIYQSTVQEKILPQVVDKIIQHHITQLIVERNTDTSLKALLTKMLNDKGVSFCNIEEKYNYLKKEERITNQQNNIKTLIRFPAEHLYSKASQMGKFMFDLVNYTWGTKDFHDDSIDSETLYCERFCDITKSNKTIGTFKR